MVIIKNFRGKIINRINGTLFGKKFYQMTKKKNAENYKHIIYYCSYHNTKLNSQSYNKSGRKKLVRKCNARIYYKKIITNIIWT